MAKVEKELKEIAYQILHSDSTELKEELNKKFIATLRIILQRKDSYYYPFDSIKTISRIAPEDDDFRIFTWHLVNQYTSEHHYYGIIQRRIWKDAQKKDFDIVLIPLKDRVDKSPQAEVMQLTADKWLGALYYKPRNSAYGVLTYKGQFQRFNPLTQKVKNETIKYYVLLGWNGHIFGSNYKIIEVITFDPVDPQKVYFGAPIFHFSQVPRYRCVFKYSENAPFNLNLNYVVQPRALIGNKKELMITFDHIAAPRETRAKNDNDWEYGPDGTVDAFRFYDRRYFERRKGVFWVVRDVRVYDKSIEKYKPGQLRKQLKQERKNLQKYHLENSIFEHAPPSKRRKKEEEKEKDKPVSNEVIKENTPADSKNTIDTNAIPPEDK
jgi:hypothetical protein